MSQLAEYVQKSLINYEYIQSLSTVEEKNEYRKNLTELELMGVEWANRFQSSKMYSILYILSRALGEYENYNKWFLSWEQPEQRTNFTQLDVEFVQSLDENYLADTGKDRSKIIEEGRIYIPAKGARLRAFISLFNVNDPEKLAKDIYNKSIEYLDEIDSEYGFVIFDIRSNLENLLQNPIDFITKDILDELLMEEFHNNHTSDVNNTFHTFCSEVNFLRMLVNLSQEQWPLSDNNQPYITFLQKLGSFYITGKNLLEDKNECSSFIKSNQDFYELIKNAKDNTENGEDPYEMLANSIDCEKEDILKFEMQYSKRQTKISSLTNLEILLEQLNTTIMKCVVVLVERMHQGSDPALELQEGWEVGELINGYDRVELIRSINIAFGCGNEDQCLLRELLLNICHPENTERSLVEVIADTINLETLTTSPEHDESLITSITHI